jgi:hypothetical protein
VVGTAARTRQDPVTGCPTAQTPPPRGAVYLSLYEYSSLDRPLVLPGKFSLPLSPDQFGSRGPDGSVQHGIVTGGNDCDRLALGVTQFGDFEDIPFQDGNRFLVARIVTVGTDPSYRWVRSGEAVLKTLHVERKAGT